MTDSVIALPQGGRWDDSMAPAYGLRTGGTAPTFAAMKGNIYGYRFDTNDEMHGCIQLPHQTVNDPEIRLHCHFMFAATTTNAATVIFSVEWMWATPTGTFSSPATSSATHTISGDENNKHNIINILTTTLTGAGPSSLVVFRIYRSGGTSAVHPFFLSIDAHFQRGRFGSVNEYDYVGG